MATATSATSVESRGTLHGIVAVVEARVVSSWPVVGDSVDVVVAVADQV